MSPGIAKYILPQHPRTLEKLLELAEAEEEYLETYGGLINQREVNITQRDETVLEAARQLQALNVSKASDNDKENYRPKITGNKRPFSPSSSHLQRDRNNVKTGSHQDVRCYFCARPGHIARECRTRARYMRDGQESTQHAGTTGRTHLPNVSSPRPSSTRSVAGSHQFGKNHVSFNLPPREARSTWVDFIVNQQPYPKSKNGVRYPPKGGSITPFPFKNQPKYLMRK
jgi:hypothetical protein